MMNVWHLIWVLPLSYMAGFAMAALLSAKM